MPNTEFFYLIENLIIAIQLTVKNDTFAINNNKMAVTLLQPSAIYLVNH